MNVAATLCIGFGALRGGQALLANHEANIAEANVEAFTAQGYAGVSAVPLQQERADDYQQECDEYQTEATASIVMAGICLWRGRLLRNRRRLTMKTGFRNSIPLYGVHPD